MSRWHEPIDRRPGRPPNVRAVGNSVIYEMAPIGGPLFAGLFVPTPRTRLILRCDDTGHIWASISDRRVKR